MHSLHGPANSAAIQAADRPVSAERLRVPATRAVADVFDGSSPDWDGILSGFSDVSLEQAASYTRGKWGKRAKCYLVRRDGAVIGGAIALEFSPPGLRTGLSFLKFGPFWRRRGVDGNHDDFVTVIRALQHRICTQERRYLAVVPRPSPAFNGMEAEALKALDFQVREPAIDPHRYLVDLHLDEDAQSMSLDQKWRYNLRRAIKAGVTVAREDTNDGFAAFRSMHDDMRARKGYDTGEPIYLVPELTAALDRSMRPLIYIARHEGRPVAGAVVCLLGDMAQYVFGATASDALSLRAGYALQWHIVRDLPLETDARWYDLGGEAGSSGLKQFKKGLTGRRGTVLAIADEHIYCESPLANMFASIVFGARAARRSIRRPRQERGG